MLFTRFSRFVYFFFNDTATTEIYTLSLHDALPISRAAQRGERARDHDPARHPRHPPVAAHPSPDGAARARAGGGGRGRSEEHTSELQSRRDLVCRLLLEKKKKNIERKIELIERVLW